MKQQHQFVLSKIVATLGPASSDVDTIGKLIEAGARVFRVNFSHGTKEDFAKLLQNVRTAASRTDRFIGVLGDLSGPKLRVSKVVQGGIAVTSGQSVIFDAATTEAVAPKSADDAVVFGVNRNDFLEDIQPDQRVFIDDGNIRLTCTESSSIRVTCRVENDGLITSGKGINLPDTDLSLPSLTEWDHECIDFAVEAGFDFLALSFVRSANDVRELKSRLRELGARPAQPRKSSSNDRQYFSAFGSGGHSFIPVVAKIEKPQAMDQIAEIVDESDVIMVARGDLGVEMDVAEVPICQKKIIRTCHHHGKPSIVATQMLQSMIEAPVPTRAEATDVANAIFDGADAVMLSGETAVGAYPVQTVRTMRRINRNANDFRCAEKLTFEQPNRPRDSKYRTAALAHGVKVMASDLDVSLIVMWSELGGGASYMAQNKLPIPIIAFSSDTHALRRMSLLYGVVPRYMAKPDSTADFIKAVDELLLKNEWVESGEPIVIVSGEPVGTAGLTNRIRIHYIGEI
ncbi:MAG: pyruvate kinase [Limisphaerales bacterium]